MKYKELDREDIIQKGDEYQLHDSFNRARVWAPVYEVHFKVKCSFFMDFIPAGISFRRPIPQSVQFIKEDVA